MKLENNWRSKTIAELETGKGSDPEFDSFLVRRTHDLRKVPVGNFAIEDLRILIGQEIGLDYLIPLAIETLTENLWAEGDLFEGDLLKNVLTVKTEFWNNNKKYWIAIDELIKDYRDVILAMKFDLTNFDNNKFKLI